jgi:hypothetical protein
MLFLMGEEARVLLGFSTMRPRLPHQPGELEMEAGTGITR